MRCSPDTKTVDVLIVDDDEVARRCLGHLLTAAGYRCAEAADGHEALAAAFAAPPRVVLLDVMMPGPDGLAVARQLRNDPRTRRVPIICVSGWGDPVARLRAVRAGCAAFVAKPVDVTALLDLLTVCLPPGECPGPAGALWKVLHALRPPHWGPRRAGRLP